MPPGKAQQVGPQAGITRKLTGTVRVWDDPITYVYDTPGLMMPYLGEGDEAVEKGLKIALSCESEKPACSPERVVSSSEGHLTEASLACVPAPQLA